MKFSCSTIINKPIKAVVEAFLDPESMKQSHKDFIAKELINSNPNATGVKLFPGMFKK